MDITGSDQTQYPASVRMIVNFRVPQKAGRVFLLEQIPTFQSRHFIVKVESSYLRSLTVFTFWQSWGFMVLSVIFKTILTHSGSVTQICVFTLQLCKTDDSNLRF